MDEPTCRPDLPKHEDRIRYALAAADFLVKCQAVDGSFHPPTSRAGYNEAYDAKGMFTLLQAACMSDGAKRELYLEALGRRLDRFTQVQRTDGALPLLAGQEPAIGITNGAAPAVARLYRNMTGDGRADVMAHRALDYLARVFNDDTGFTIRSSPRDGLAYQDDFPLYACHLWSDERPELRALVDRATRYLTTAPWWDAERRFWPCGFGVSRGISLSDYAHPTLALDRAWVLFEIHGLGFADQVQGTLDAIIHTRDTLEAYYTEKGVPMAECRIRMALAGLMGTYDRYTGSRTYTSTTLYQEWRRWTIRMFDPATGGFFERIPADTNQPECQGVPAQYLAQYALTDGLLNRGLRA